MTSAGPGASTLIGPGTLVNVGASVSVNVTVTEKDLEPVLPCASVALHVTVLVPTGNVLLDPGLQTATIEPSTVSVAVTGSQLTAVPAGSVVDAVAFGGCGTDGGVVSTTCTVNVWL